MVHTNICRYICFISKLNFTMVLTVHMLSLSCRKTIEPQIPRGHHDVLLSMKMLPYLNKSLIFFANLLPHNISGLYVTSLVPTSEIFKTSRTTDGRKLRENSGLRWHHVHTSFIKIRHLVKYC